MLARSVNFNEVNRVLSLINQEAAQSASCNLQSDLVHLEDVYCGLLNFVYGLHLVNVNAAHKNYPGIDLVDESAKLCVQVTADTSSAKMCDTLAKPVMKDLAEEGYTLKFCYVGEQDKKVKRRHPANPHGIKFDASADAILSSDILSVFNHLGPGRQEEVLALLRWETGEGYVVTEGWMGEKLDRAIRLLGPRYTPDANVETPDMMKFAALTGDEAFKSDLLAKARGAASDVSRLAGLVAEGGDKGILSEMVAFFDPLSDVLAGIPDDRAPRREFEEWALRLAEATGECSRYPASWLGRERPEGKIERAFDDALYRVRAVDNACCAGGVEYLRSGRVLVCGEAGMGKSHLLADLCEKELAKGDGAVLLLGGQFNSEGSSEESIPGILGLGGSLDELLAELQRYADARGGLSVLAIDALNEGRGRSFWRYSLALLFEKVKRYSSVRLVMSVRSTYKKEVLPEAFLQGGVEELECGGFGEVSSVAVETLCDHYGIVRPTVPLIGMEFSNPLYLNLLCRHLSMRGGRFSTNVAMGDLVADLLDDVNERLADQQRLAYDVNMPLVARAVRAIVGSDGFDYGSIEYEEAAAAVVEAVRDYVSPPGAFLGELVSEGLFNVIDHWNGRRLVFSYELVGNYAVAEAAVSRAKGLQGSGQFFSASDALASLLASGWNWLADDQGVLAALSAIVPAECECELFELGLECGTAFSIVESAYVEGLPWRRIVKVTQSMDRFVRERILSNEYSMIEFFETSFQLVARRGGFDAYYFRDLLLSVPMQVRDYAWSSTMARSEKAVAFVDWAWERGEGVGEREAEPVATMLALCLAATNVQLRRKAAKALALVLIGRPVVAEGLWDAFASIDDDYVLEGLCGALYGAAVNSRDAGAWSAIAEKVCSRILGDGDAYPNAIVRDYAVLLRDAVLGPTFCVTRLDEPFSSFWRSDWYGSLPSNEDIDALRKACEGEYGEKSDQAHAVWWLIHSMTTEYSRGTCAYGDFGRYVLGGMISPWANQFESDQLLSNAVTEHILTQWYDLDLHVPYDADVKRFEGRPFYRGCERIGKKYQKIGMNRLVARLMDNFPPYQVKKIYGEGYEEYARKRSALFNACILSGDFSKLDDSEDESDWVVGEERETLSTMDVGWEFLSLRGHDPSFPWKWSTLVSPYALGETFPNLVSLDGDPDSWCGSDDELSTLNGLRVRELDGRRFYVLAAYIGWERRKYGKQCREATWLSGAVFVKKEDLDEVYGNYAGNDKGINFNDVRFGEYFDGWGYGLLGALHDSERDGLEKKVTEASYLYDWGRDREDLEDEAGSVYLPCPELVERFNLVRRGPLTWEDAEGKPASLCLVGQESGNRALLFDADMVDAYLAETGQAIMWDDYFEKQTARLIYRKWTNVKLVEGGYLTEDDEEPYCGERIRASWTDKDDWLDA